MAVQRFLVLAIWGVISFSGCGRERISKQGYLPEGTVLMTVDGPRTVESIGPGVEIVSYNDADATTDLVRVKSVYQSEVSTIHRIELEAGVALTTSKDKRVLRLNDGSWSGVGKMQKGDEVLYLDEYGEISRSPIQRVVPQSLSYPIRVYGFELDKKQGVFANDILLR